MKPILFSKTYPKHHPRAGEPTGFKEKIGKLVKIHTIREGKNWKEGEVFQPWEWIGLAYRTKQVDIHPPLKVVRVYDFLISADGGYYVDGNLIDYNNLKQIAFNDGFNNVDDFECWFDWHPGDEFDGQIICWKDPEYFPRKS